MKPQYFRIESNEEISARRVTLALNTYFNRNDILAEIKVRKIRLNPNSNKDAIKWNKLMDLLRRTNEKR